MRKISIDPVTRLEGHGRIDIFLDGEGNVENTYFIVPELRGFEQFCVGRLAEDMPVLTNRICGVCPEAHHMASVKALDMLFGVEPPPAAKKIRELLYMAFFVTDHTTHFYALGGPDFIVGPDAPPSERNILGVIRKVGIDIGKEVIGTRARNHHVIEMLGGRGVHLTGGLPGGWSKSLSKEEIEEIKDTAKKNIDFALFSLKAFDDIVLNNPVYKELILSDIYVHKTYYMGTVDENNSVNFYDGKIRIVDPEGNEYVKYDSADYAEHIAERVEPWTYLKYPYIKKIGWKGFVDGADSGVYCATPLSRLNVSDKMATPLAQENFERMYDTLSGKGANGRYKPVHHRLATHWARLIELLYAAEHMLELAGDPETGSPHVRNIPEGVNGSAEAAGIGSVEAPRGTLTHHYVSDGKGVIKKVNLIVGTTNNYASMTMSIKRAAEKLIIKGKVVEEGLLNKIEMAFRLYDPCLSCSTHSLPGQMPLIINIKNKDGETFKTITRNSWD
ncbi:MAG: Ni/Fe hydrogenase subunit alpha [bacterium]